MSNQLKSTIAAALTAAVLAYAGAAQAATHFPPSAPGHNKLLCFDGTTDGGFGGTCTLTANGAKGPATLNNTDSNPNGDYAGVYTQVSSMYGQLLTQIKVLGYTYTGTIAPQPGNLSINVPIDTTNDGTTDAYAFIDAFYCPGVLGAVDVINDPNCGIYYGGTVFYPNWAALIAGLPAASRVATDNYAFVIAERTPAEPAASWTVTGVTFGNPGGSKK